MPFILAILIIGATIFGIKKDRVKDPVGTKEYFQGDNTSQPKNQDLTKN